MWKFTLASFCILNAILTVFGEGKYTVVGPGTIHSDSKYNVVAGVYLTKEPCQLKIGITGPSYNETKTVTLQGDELQNIEFDVPVLEKGVYNLTAEGVTGISFKNTTELNYEDFKPHTKIQTDKGAYKPGDVINFRVLFLDENLRPAKPPADTIIYFEDGKRNRIKEIKNIEVIKGVYTGNFKLSEYPVLGNWRIAVSAGERYPSSVYFEVSKYVLPKYIVKVEATEKVSVKDGDMQVVVRSNYTYGEPVNGKVTLLLGLNTHSIHFFDSNEQKVAQPDPPILIKTTNMVNGKAKFDLNVKEYESYLVHKTYPYYLSITATVEENFTGVKLNSTTGTMLYPYRYAMRCASEQICYQFHPNKESNLTIHISHVDGTSLKDTKSTVKLIYTEDLTKYWGYDENKEAKNENKEFVFESHMNETGMADFKVSLPELTDYENYTHAYKMRVEYADEVVDLNQIYQLREPKYLDNIETPKEPMNYFKSNVQYENKTYEYNLGNEATFTLNSSEPIPYFVYVLVGRGNILHTERINLPDQPKIYNFTFTTTFAMAPSGRIYFHYIDQLGELHFTETYFSVNAELQNKIEITSTDKVKPGGEVALHIKTAPNSFVGLLAVDQSVLLFKQNNEIDENSFIWRLGSYSTYTRRQGGFSPYPGEVAGLVTLTNADYLYNRTRPDSKWSLLERSGTHHEDHSTFRSPVLKSSPASGFVRLSSSSQSIGSIKSTIAVRKDFSETWIFDNINNTETEEFTWSKVIPDTITSWVLKGFSVNEEKGLGVTKEATKIKTFQPFFISIRLPYSVKRGEVINVPALVFNYLDKDLDVEVVLDNTDNEYEFTDVTNEIINEPKRSKTIRVASNSATGVSFMIRPKIIGNIMLKFTAISPIAGDAIHKTLKVVAEGVTEYANRAYLVNLKDSSEFKESFELKLPNQIVPHSQHVEFAVVGDLLGPVLLNIENLIRMPTGCGEQTTSQLVFNYVVLEYLKNTNNFKPAIEMKIKHNLETGYQNILNYRHDDGAFSSFGPSTKEDKPINGSTWLTAYIVRNLQKSKKYVDINDKILEEGLSYLAKSQAENGSFIEKGDYFYSSQKDHIVLTANVLLAFLENKTLSAKYQTNIDNGFKYILENIEKAENVYVKVLAAYTLHIAELPSSKDIISSLKGLAKTEDDRMWWSKTENKRDVWWRWAHSNDVEITSYMLLLLLDNPSETTDSVLPIIRWLVAQRNSYGGFSSTQDTVVGLQALTKFVLKSGYKAADMEINVISKTGDKIHQETITTNNDNALLMQSVELPAKTTAIDFHTKGKGAALVQISYQYNVIESEEKPTFTIKSIVNKDVPPFKLDLIVCVDYAGANEASNMAVLEVSMPSGYMVDTDNFENILSVNRVRHVETKNSESILVIYIESLHKNEKQCLPVEAFKSFPVAKQKPASVVVYDYYDPTKKATDYYEVESKLCDICEDEDCKKHCEST